MTDLDTRIQQALHAQAGQLTEQELTPMRPPRSQHSSWRLPILAAAAVVLLAVAGTLGIRAATDSNGHRSAPAVGGPSPTLTAPGSAGPSPTDTGRPSLTEPPTPADSVPTGNDLMGPTGSVSPELTAPATGLPAGYLPLWPIDAIGLGTPYGDAQQTALRFTSDYLQLPYLDLVTSSRFDGSGAHIGIGYRNPAGQPATAAVLHLVQYADNGPWEVVGSDDTTFSLEQPAYGSTVSGRTTVGGHITGVDEQVLVRLRTQAYPTPATYSTPAGGQDSPWQVTVAFPGSGVWTVTAFTGGHVLPVERFAIQGVRVK